MKSSIVLLSLASILYNGLQAQSTKLQQVIFAAELIHIERVDDLVLPIPADEIIGYSILVNDKLYEDSLEPVMMRAIVGYTLDAVGTGTFYVHDFEVSEVTTVSGKYNSPEAFYRDLAAQDPEGEWKYDPATLTIYGGRLDATYGPLELTAADSEGRTIALHPRKGSLAMAVRMVLPRGDHKIEVIKKATSHRAVARVKVGEGSPVSIKG